MIVYAAGQQKQRLVVMLISDNVIRLSYVP